MELSWESAKRKWHCFEIHLPLKLFYQSSEVFSPPTDNRLYFNFLIFNINYIGNVLLLFTFLNNSFQVHNLTSALNLK